MGTDEEDEKRVLAYDRERPPDPWKRGWRSWLLQFAGEIIAQVVLPIVVGAAVIRYMTYCSGR